MLKWKIVRTTDLMKKHQRLVDLENEKEVLQGEKIVLKGIIDDCENTQKELKEAHQKEIEALKKTYEEEVTSEKEKHARYVAKQKEKSVLAKKKWLNGYPDEDFKG